MVGPRAPVLASAVVTGVVSVRLAADSGAEVAAACVLGTPNIVLRTIVILFLQLDLGFHFMGIG